MKHLVAPYSASKDETQLRDRAALLGHDIRNAVSDIMGGLKLADLSALDPNSKQQLDRVRSASEQLARLTDEILALATGEVVDTPQHPRQVLKLSPLLEEWNARWSAHAHETGIVFNLSRGEDLPANIGADRNALDRILANLIGNAIKYGEHGNVTLSISMQARETLTFRVRDHGPGFSDAALARLFEFRARTPENSKPGSGMGLHIVRNLTESIGGHMEVGNHPGGGAEITILLPAIAWAPGVSNPSNPAYLPNLTGKCVLLAEDNPTNQLLIRQMIETLGADCRVASDGEEALELLKSHHFNLALVDIEMPRLSGLDLIRVMRQFDNDVCELPVLAVTAYVLSANRDGIYEAGADGILAKPILSLEAFGEAIHGVLDKHEKGGASRSHRHQTLGPPLNNLHLDRLLALAGAEGGQELLQRLIQDFETVRQGIADSLQTNNYPKLRARTHVLISLAGAIGADGLQHDASALNTAAQEKDTTTCHTLGPQAVRRITAASDRLREEYANRFGGLAP